jgi:stage V sporulation protein S
MHDEAAIVRVAADSRPTAVAGAIAGMVRTGTHPIVQAIGAGAVNQAVKALIIARGYLESDGVNIACVPSFSEMIIDGLERTAVRLEVILR